MGLDQRAKRECFHWENPEIYDPAIYKKVRRFLLSYCVFYHPSYLLHLSQRTLPRCWSNAGPIGPALDQHRGSVSHFITRHFIFILHHKCCYYGRLDTGLTTGSHGHLWVGELRDGPGQWRVHSGSDHGWPLGAGTGQVTGQAQCKREAIGRAGGGGGVNHCSSAGRNSNHFTENEYQF